jgi:hypothetical protein
VGNAHAIILFAAQHPPQIAIRNRVFGLWDAVSHLSKLQKQRVTRPDEEKTHCGTSNTQ